VSLVVMVLAGGMGTLVGPVLGALVFTILPEMLRASDRYRLVIYGSVIVLLVRFAPEGIWGLMLKSLSVIRHQRRTEESVPSDRKDEEPASVEHRVETAAPSMTEEEKTPASRPGTG
jgi:branched-chain amino acid transport system permease protein